MADYYDRLEAQLADLTERGAHRRGLTNRLPAARIGIAGLRVESGALAVAAELFVVVAVGLVFLGIRSGPRLAHHAPPVTTHPAGPPVIRNYGHAKLPPTPGPLVCNSDLERPGVIPGLTSSPGGTVRVYSKPPAGGQMIINATGLTPNSAGNLYAVWIEPARQTTTGYRLAPEHTPRLLGVIVPRVGADGTLTTDSVLPPADTNGAFLMRITLQPKGQVTGPGRTIIEGYASL
jgi:hypothetical protein